MIKAAVTQVWYDNDPKTHRAYGVFQYGLNQSYANLLDHPGLLPLALLPTDSITPDDILKNFDILILTGGGDPSPFLFGREDRGSRKPRPYRSTWDMRIYHAARERRMPILGICLGMQLMGIAEGVALIQDIPDTGVFHDGSTDNPASHPVSLSPGTTLHSLFGEKTTVSSFHHQVLEEVPPGYTVSARSSDGLIEAIESSDGSVLGVQWHPERDSTGEPILEAMLKLIGRS
ncbi:MAG: gamma-glutamyl-gamma-aminobutyrate hydrolase family protein [Candidatus Sabulitectum sp.]|nr:gamma-glutamyl-gamma-aminobutyrate hydrolase family protein [Candidatus Sabulitectum sp.]